MDRARIGPDQTGCLTMDAMRGFLRVILNVIWLVLAGLPMALAYAAAGIICFILSLIYNRYAQEQRREQMSGAQERNRI